MATTIEQRTHWASLDDDERDEIQAEARTESRAAAASNPSGEGWTDGEIHDWALATAWERSDAGIAESRARAAAQINARAAREDEVVACSECGIEAPRSEQHSIGWEGKVVLCSTCAFA